MLDVGSQVSLIVACIGVASAVVAALLSSLLSRRHQREHQQREVMMKPSEEYARKTLEALAALRYVTPPPVREAPELPHRNEGLLLDGAMRAQRLARCESAIDAVRATRAHLRLVFHPASEVSAHAARVLALLRSCFSAASAYYAAADREAGQGPGGHAQEWRRDAGDALRQEYLRLRKELYGELDLFILSVTHRLEKPLRKVRAR